jgi:hypothetical protein
MRANTGDDLHTLSEEPGLLHLLRHTDADRPQQRDDEDGELDMTGVERIEQQLSLLTDEVNLLGKKLAILEHDVGPGLLLRDTVHSMQLELVTIRGEMNVQAERLGTAKTDLARTAAEGVACANKIVDLEKMRWQLMGAAGGVSLAVGLAQWALSYLK